MSTLRMLSGVLATLFLLMLAPHPQVAFAARPSPRVAQAAVGLSSKDAVLRARAAAQLGAMGAEAVPAVPVLLRLLSDEAEVSTGIRFECWVVDKKDTTVAGVAAIALGRIGDKRAVGPLCNLMLSTRRRVNRRAQESAATALGLIGDAQAVPSLCRALCDTMITDAAEDALVRIGEPAVKPMANAAASGRPGLCQKAVGILGKIGKPAVPSLVKLMRRGRGDVARLAARALGSTGELVALEALCEALRDPEADLRCAAVSGLSFFRYSAKEAEPGGEEGLKAFVVALEGEAVDPVVAVFEDKSRPVETRKDAGFVLGQSRNPRAVGPLVEAIVAGSNDEIRRAGLLGICDLTLHISSGPPWFDPEVPDGKEGWSKTRADLMDALKRKALWPLVSALSWCPSHAQMALRHLSGQNYKTPTEWEAWLKEQENK